MLEQIPSLEGTLGDSAESMKRAMDVIKGAEQKVELIYVDPVAVVSIVVSVVMLATMLTGVLALRKDWAAYEQMATYVSYLNRENAKLELEYRAGYDLADIESKALALGLVPRDQLETRTVTVTMPVEAPQPGRIDQIRQYFEDMFS